MLSQSQNSRMTFRYNHFLIWLLIFTFFLPAPLAVNAASAQNQDMLLAEVAGWNRHIHERLNSAERRAAIAEAARKEAENASAIGGHDRNAGKSSSVSATPAIRGHDRNAGKSSSVSASVNGISDRVPELRDKTTTIAQQPEFGDTTRNGKTISVMSPNSSPRPQSVGEVLFNHAASFMGVPGLTPQRDKYGNYDEGLGFHQDGTVRKAGGTTASGPSDRGQRAQAYMRSGIQGEAGPGYASTIWEPGYDAATGTHWRGDPTRGGRISAFSGSQSRSLDDFDPLNMALDRGLSFGNSFINSMGEAAISGLVDGGRARLNFYFDKDGYFSGEGDALLPFYDSTHTTIFTQLGARSMSAEDTEDRWIGNFGLGQRWFPAATEEDAGNWMIGYNAFFDYDFTRDHQRGGVGVEAQYDWLRLASNYYFPLSNWKGSEDFDSRFVKERPAEGWDVRAKGYLPFYRNIAITGAYTQWYGDNVGMFGASELEKDPRVWSYGIEYTPIPLVSGFITQKSTERGRTDTEFGLNLTYHFNMPWEEQTSHAKVAELRTVGGSRHEFVDRENRIILEYKAKSNFRIEYIGKSGASTFRFRIINGFGEFIAGKTVQVSAGGGVNLAAAPASGPASREGVSLFAQALNFIDELISVSTAHAASSVTKITNSRGEFDVTITSAIGGQITLTASIDGAEASVTVGVEASSSGSLTASGGGTAVNGAVVQLIFDGGPALAGKDVAWSVVSGGTVTGTLITNTTTDASGVSTNSLKVSPTGSGTITVTAEVDGTKHTVTLTVDAAASSGLTASDNTVANGGNVTLTLKTPYPNSAITWDVSSIAPPLGSLTVEPPNTDGDGSATTTLKANPTGSGTIAVTAEVDGEFYTCTVTIVNYIITFQPFPTPSNFSDHSGVTETFTVKIQGNGANVPDGAEVTWSVASTDLTDNKAVATAKQSTFEGLTLNGGTEVTGTGTTVTSTTTGGEATMTLKDILGERKVTVTASISSPGSASATSSTFTFGQGPLAKFSLGYPGNPDNEVDWSTAISTCRGSMPSFTLTPTYYSQTKLPGATSADVAAATLTNISGSEYAAMRNAAGLPSDYVWSGSAYAHVDDDIAAIVRLSSGGRSWGTVVGEDSQVLCVRQ
ncbi:inverse autotransporter beta domain-containing protein [Desulfovibrio sp. OttesenSCG-928-M16]|nr:inverse autotransporter beta domain-containing protein [Desulfovibrio sp. OttesenSCG-928-M16]